MRVRVLVPIVLLSLASLVVSMAAPMAGATPSKGSGSGSSSSSAKAAKKNGSTKASATTSAGRRTHIVRSGDTVPSIARRYGVDADDVRAANGIVDDKLYLGARLIIDGSAASSSGSSSTKSSSGSPATKRISSTTPGATYRVKDGDYLDGIAHKYGVSLSSLLKANDLQTDSLILPGDSLVIPSGSSGSSSSGSTASSSTKNSAGSASASSTSAGSVGPDIRCPVAGASFMNDWGFPRDEGTRFHEGTDMFAPTGTTIVAPAGGTVVYGTNPLGGHTFTLTTSSGWVFYGADTSKAIGSSRQVGTGEAIARVGSSGNAAGGDTHLHLGIKRSGGSPINPYPSLRAACR